MRIAQALDFLHASNAAQFDPLSDLISPELIIPLLREEGVVTLRRWRLPVERLVWAIIGMAMFRHVPMTPWSIGSTSCGPATAPSWPPVPSCKPAKRSGTKASSACFRTPLLTRTIEGKERQVLTSLVDPMRFPGADIVELYRHHWGPGR